MLSRAEAVKYWVCQYFHRLLNEKDISVCDEMLADEYVDHDAPSNTPPGPQSIKEYVARFLEAYPDLHVDIIDLLAEGDRAAVRLEWSGHHRNSREKFYQAGMIFLRLNDKGQFVERWSMYQALK